MSRWLGHREHSRCPCSLPFCRPGKPPRCPRYHHAAIWSRHLSLYWSQGFSTWSNRLRQEIALFPTEKANRLREGNRVELRCSTSAVGRRARAQPGRQAGSGTAVSAAVEVAEGGTSAEVHCHATKTVFLTSLLMQQQHLLCCLINSLQNYNSKSCTFFKGSTLGICVRMQKARPSPLIKKTVIRRAVFFAFKSFR